MIEAAMLFLLLATALIATWPLQEQILQQLFARHRFYLIHPFP